MTPPLLRTVPERRFDPLSRYGYGVFREGLRTRDTPRTITGAAFVVAGVILRRRAQRARRRKSLYRAHLASGESMQVRVLENGVEVDVIDVPEA